MNRTRVASVEYGGKKRKTGRERLLAQMDAVVAWSRLEKLVGPPYLGNGKVSRPPIGGPRMLRMYFLQQWSALADETPEDALYQTPIVDPWGECVRSMSEGATVTAEQAEIPSVAAQQRCGGAVSDAPRAARRRRVPCSATSWRSFLGATSITSRYGKGRTE